MGAKWVVGAKPTAGVKPIVLYTVGALCILGLALFGYLQYADRHAPKETPLSAEARAYVREGHLPLTDRLEITRSSNSRDSFTLFIFFKRLARPIIGRSNSRSPWSGSASYMAIAFP